MYLDEPVLSDDVCSAKNSYDAYYDEDIMICAGYANGEIERIFGTCHFDGSHL